MPAGESALLAFGITTNVRSEIAGGRGLLRYPARHEALAAADMIV